MENRSGTRGKSNTLELEQCACGGSGGHVCQLYETRDLFKQSAILSESLLEEMKGNPNVADNNQAEAGPPEVVYSPRAQTDMDHRNEREHLMIKYVEMMDTPPVSA